MRYRRHRYTHQGNRAANNNLSCYESKLSVECTANVSATAALQPANESGRCPLPLTELFVVRHGLAASDRQDPERRLTSEGRSKVERAAAVLEAAQVQVDVIYHSGKARAEQTAEVLAEVLKPAAGLRWRRGLNPNDPVDEIVPELDADEHERVMLVGHLPNVERLLAYLLASRSDPPIVHCSEASITSLIRTDRGWRLRWMLDPALVES